MAQSHTTNGEAYTNPEVRFERSDVQYRAIVIFAVILCVSLLVVAAAMTWFGNVLLGLDQPRKITTLPPAAVDDDRLPPEPRLEGIDDVRTNRVRLYPARAEEYYAEQKQLLEQGNTEKGIVPIGKAIDALAGRLRSKSTGGR